MNSQTLSEKIREWSKQSSVQKSIGDSLLRDLVRIKRDYSGRLRESLEASVELAFGRYERALRASGVIGEELVTQPCEVPRLSDDSAGIAVGGARLASRQAGGLRRTSGWDGSALFYWGKTQLSRYDVN